ncbi:hypothetical protein J4G37_11235 [Microvirga sp. 3-52]|nr:hypothetical protein [Microvirga sp. 3-52]
MTVDAFEVAQAIIDWAASEGCDHIVVGTRDLPLLGRVPARGGLRSRRRQGAVNSDRRVLSAIMPPRPGAKTCRDGAVHASGPLSTSAAPTQTGTGHDARRASRLERAMGSLKWSRRDTLGLPSGEFQTASTRDRSGAASQVRVGFAQPEIRVMPDCAKPTDT